MLEFEAKAEQSFNRSTIGSNSHSDKRFDRLPDTRPMASPRRFRVSSGRSPRGEPRARQEALILSGGPVSACPEPAAPTPGDAPDHEPVGRRRHPRARTPLQRGVGRPRSRGPGRSLVDDAPFMPSTSTWTTSRAGFRDLMQRLHGANGPYRSSTRKTPEMQVRFLSPDIAILHSRFWIDGEVLHDALSQAVARERRHARGAQDRRALADRRDAEHRCPPRAAAFARGGNSRRYDRPPPSCNVAC